MLVLAVSHEIAEAEKNSGLIFKFVLFMMLKIELTVSQSVFFSSCSIWLVS